MSPNDTPESQPPTPAPTPPASSSPKSAVPQPQPQTVQYVPVQSQAMQPGMMQGQDQGAGIGVDDVIFTLFRHKWKIIFFTLMGIAGAAFYLRVVHKPMYQSEAKLLVRYITESRSINPVGSDRDVKSPDSRGANIINSEIQILTSWDLANRVAQQVGPERIVGTTGTEGSLLNIATGMILGNLGVDVPRGSNVIRITFSHGDPAVAQDVLRTLKNGYLEDHVRIHREVGADNFLAEQTDQLRSRLLATEDELRKLKAQAGVASIETSKMAIATQVAKIRELLLASEAELAAYQATVQELKRWSGAATANQQSSTNDTDSASQTPPNRELLATARNLYENLTSLRRKELEMLGQFKPDSKPIQNLRNRIADAERRKAEFEARNPELALPSFAVASASQTGDGPNSATRDAIEEIARTAGLRAKIDRLNAQLNDLKTQATGIDTVENAITQLQRKKELEEANYRYFAASLEQARFDEALDAGKVSNISTVQEPSPAAPHAAKLRKLLGGILAGGIGFGLGLAFLIDFILDASIKRPKDLEKRLRIPIDMSIPRLKGTGRVVKDKKRKKNTIADGDESSPKIWEQHDQFSGYCETLRDHLVMWFESKGLTHKPKLVGVTSANEGAGVTTIASGLASALSETGDGNVLLVDLNVKNGHVHPFFRGKEITPLADSFESEKRESGFVQKCLYAASAAETNGHPRPIPKTFSALMPKMKASDYDYIIFDMPPINQNNPIYRLTGMLDKTLLVVESEKSNRTTVQRARDLLAESNAEVSSVFNKTQRRCPRFLLPSDA